MGIEGIGARVLRKEDKRFITGQGRYTDDITDRDMTHGVFVRSPHAHAKITRRAGADRRRGGQYHLRLDDLFQGRLGHEGGALASHGP